jgi:probable HAF family extracellular repeat protein
MPDSGSQDCSDCSTDLEKRWTFRSRTIETTKQLDNLGQATGVAEPGTSDSSYATETPSQKLQFEAVIWGANGKALLPLKGDTVGYALGINDNGQTVGVSGLCSNTSPPPVNPFSGAPHGVLWESDGSAVNLGNLGGQSSFTGSTFIVPSSINGLGQVAGTGSSKDGTLHLFLWSKDTGIQDLGTFPGAIATAITCCNTLNNSGDAVGQTVEASFNSRAFLWQDKILTDLNTLIPADSPLYLTGSASINDSGQIVGNGIVKNSCPPATPPAPPAWQANPGACIEIHAFLATPHP